jgi:glycosyltransferase involved in cell wall biosynthesis
MAPKRSSSVTVGVPVYNGERFIASALDSLLSQTYNDYEVIISDNASTDNTPQICAEYVRRDSRFTYTRNHINIGAPRNFNKCFEYSKSELFVWLSSDDVYAPTYLEKCVFLLKSKADLAMAYANCEIIDKDGKVIERISKYYNLAESSRVVLRLASVFFQDPRAVSVFGVFRRSCLERTGLTRSIFNGDRLLLAEAALTGKFGRVPEFLFQNRSHPSRFSENWESLSASEWMDHDRASRGRHPLWAWFPDGMDVVAKLPLPVRWVGYLLVLAYAVKYFPFWLGHKIPLIKRLVLCSKQLAKVFFPRARTTLRKQ